MKQTSIPWCDRRRAYCAFGCSVGGLSNSGQCDWQRQMAARPPSNHVELPDEQQPASLRSDRPEHRQDQQHHHHFGRYGRRGTGRSDRAQAKPKRP